MSDKNEIRIDGDGAKAIIETCDALLSGSELAGPTGSTAIQRPFVGRPMLVWWCCQRCATKNWKDMSKASEYTRCRDCGLATRLMLEP